MDKTEKSIYIQSPFSGSRDAFQVQSGTYSFLVKFD